MCIRIDVLAGLFSAGLAAYLVYGEGISASNTGFSLTMAGMFARILPSLQSLILPKSGSVV